MSNEKRCAIEPPQKRICPEPFVTQFLGACKRGDVADVVSLAKDSQAIADARRDNKNFNYEARM